MVLLNWTVFYIWYSNAAYVIHVHGHDATNIYFSDIVQKVTQSWPYDEGKSQATGVSYDELLVMIEFGVHFEGEILLVYSWPNNIANEYASSADQMTKGPSV